MKNNSNPWKGLDSYGYSDREVFYGRSREIKALMNTILSNHFTILYGQSGVGKSSLLKAGITPRLSEKFFLININMRELDLTSSISIGSQLIECIRKQAKEKEIDIYYISDENIQSDFNNFLWFFFHTSEFWSQKNEPLTPVVIIDQFEEIFKDEADASLTNSFFEELDELSSAVPPMSIRNRVDNSNSFRYSQSSEFRFIFSLREDYLPRLDDYVYSINIPELRKSRFGVMAMDSTQAMEVIMSPANGLVSEQVAQKIINILSFKNTGKYVSNKIEPFLLSLYMYRVYNEMVKKGLPVISEDLINTIGADVVNDFYIETMKKISSKAVRHLENVLLTPKGHRDSISIDKLMETEKISSPELHYLLKSRIVKKNTVNGVDRLEFTHDILSQYAVINKEMREKESKSKLIFGYIGSMLVISLSFAIGFFLSETLTYISIPILVPISILCAFGIFNRKLNFKRSTIRTLILCSVLGIGIDLVQILPGIGYILYLSICCIAICVLFALINKTTQIDGRLLTPKNCLFVGYMVVFAIILIPCLCFGYNIYSGMNYARGEEFVADYFYIKNKNGEYGIRNRKSILVEPQYKTPLIKHETDYIAQIDGFFGLLDSCLDIKRPFKYSNYIIDDSDVHFYIGNKEIVDNGLQIEWQPLTTEDQKKVIRKIVSNMVNIEGGDFKMGTDLDKVQKQIRGFRPSLGEEALHDVRLTDFYINKYEVTVEDWETIMGFDPRQMEPINKSDLIENGDIPVYKISYNECLKFIENLSKLSNINFSLPTEAQWEYAAKGGKNHDDYYFAGSNNEFDVAWIARNSDHMVHAVGLKKANSLGLYDMTGNVSEFCKDNISQSFYKESQGQTNPCYESTDTKTQLYVVRGGSYESFHQDNYITSRRSKVDPKTKYRSVGFRVVVNPG